MPGSSVHAITARKLLSHFSPRYGLLGSGKFVLGSRRKSSNMETRSSRCSQYTSTLRREGTRVLVLYKYSTAHGKTKHIGIIQLPRFPLPTETNLYFTYFTISGYDQTKTDSEPLVPNTYFHSTAEEQVNRQEVGVVRFKAIPMYFQPDAPDSVQSPLIWY